MADAVTAVTLHDGPKWVVRSLTNVSDGTGESAVLKVDVSSLTPFRGRPCTGVKLYKVQYAVQGMVASLLWDATTDVRFAVLQGDGEIDYSCTSPLVNTSGDGRNGDVLLTTTGHSSGDSYSIIIKMQKTYD